jgi:Fur family ferric uptake transcriptional regulator
MRVLELIRSSPQRHLTADDIYRLVLDEKMGIGLATVYRVLGQLEQAGILTRSTFEAGKAVFEVNEGTHHDHLICIACGAVDEFHDRAIERRQLAVAAEHGYELQDHSLALYGLCPKCKAVKPEA